MQFKHPELLFALLLLIIPILIHLFQLRKFQKTPFTNVKFLKEVTIQTRKSSKLKKWLVLLSRLFALACIILAFAQPYTSQTTETTIEAETVIYIDNSLSLQAKGNQGELLKNATQQLFSNSNVPQQLSWFSNNTSSRQVTREDFKNEVLNLDYSSNSLTFDEALLKAETLFSRDETTSKNLVWISDFQGQQNFPEVSNSPIKISTVRLQPANTNNLSVDSLYVSAVNSASLELTVLLENYGIAVDNVPIGLYQGENLIARTSAQIGANASATATFEIDDEEFSGRISITDESLLFDNDLYFNINEKSPIKVLSIYENPSNYLRRIYTDDEFEWQAQQINQLDFNILNQQNTIILNELNEIPTVLQNALMAFVENNGTLVIIPNVEADLVTYNSFLNRLNFGTLTKSESVDRQITTIHFAHPVYQNVFENQITNFQYPSVKNYFTLNRKHTPVLSFESNEDFLIQNQNVYLFSGALNTDNSNFINSPLVVPTFYRIGKQSLPLSNLYYTIGEHNEFAVAVSLPQDHILNIRNAQTDFIPLQRNSSNSVLITTTDQPETAGIFGIYDRDNRIENVSYNHSRSESRMVYMDPASWQGVENYNSINAVFQELASASDVKNLWKWFVILALLFLAIEMFLLKFLK
jgi:hypothetical protein